MTTGHEKDIDALRTGRYRTPAASGHDTAGKASGCSDTIRTVTCFLH